MNNYTAPPTAPLHLTFKQSEFLQTVIDMTEPEMLIAFGFLFFAACLAFAAYIEHLNRRRGRVLAFAATAALSLSCALSRLLA